MNAEDYLLKECEQLRTMYSENAKEIWDGERYCLLATGAIWSWCAANPNALGVRYLLWAPVLLTGVLSLRAWATYAKMAAIQAYLRKVENTAGLDHGLGWERGFAQQAGKFRTATGWAFWLILIATTIGVAVAFGRSSA